MVEEIISTQKKSAKLEFWAVTVAFGFAVLSLISDSNVMNGLFSGTFALFISHYMKEFAEITALYFGFLLLNFYVLPKLIQRQFVIRSVALIFLTYAVITLAYGSADVGLAALFIFAIYSVLKYGGILLWINSEAIDQRLRFIAPGGFVAFILWLLSMFLFLIGDADMGVVAAWALLIPTGIFLYSYSFFVLIPKALEQKRPLANYVLRVLAFIAIASVPVSIFGLLITHDDDSSLALSFANLFFQLLITSPFSWFYYKRYRRGSEELSTLKKELGQSAASFDFLRSQINPHFLFNALNTLYGTALQEKAERTGEGIQRLGDMMRFMLQENMQEKISLAREVEYLNNYISLQRLRTDPIPGVSIQTEIQQPVSLVQISPMLLIPFVENAFKHGISLRETSHIKVTLEVRNKTIYFDVYNSKHPKHAHDPEKDKSGIGLQNVKQRLQLLYPDKHELVLRETVKEFFIHLTIQLS